MSFNSKYSLELGLKVDLYFNLLSDEDFEFKTKNILINISKNNTIIDIDIICTNLLDLKVANSAIIKSLEIITKTLKI